LKFPKLLFFLAILLFLSGCIFAGERRIPLSISNPVIVDHNCTDLAKIPSDLIDSIKQNIKWYYAHTSHGEQLIVGLQELERLNSFYDIEIKRKWLPDKTGALAILDNPYAGPEDYWKGERGILQTENIIDSFPINISMWSWCGQLETYSEKDVQSYLKTLDKLQEAHPDTLFIYMTGNAQKGGRKGYNRWLRNNQIRRWVKEHPGKHRVLFDFADLDSWWFNPKTKRWEQATYRYWTGSKFVSIPIEHPEYHGNERAHTTLESCRQKGKAVWWMLARLSGWNY